MGRVLDTLKQGGASRATVPANEADSRGEAFLVDWTASDDAVPFIEVGAPGKRVETSPGLMLPHPPQAKVQPPHAPVERSAPAGVVSLTEARPMAVAFEPWPGAGARAVAPEVIAYHQPEHPVSLEYAALADALLDNAPGVGTPALLLTGVRSRVGTSTVVLNVAVALARGGARRVALLEAHWARPGLAARLGHAGAGGVHDVLGGRLALEQAVLATPVPALSLLPAGPGKPAAAPGAEAATWLLAWLRERYDLVLIDGPSLESTADLAALAPACDGMYFVLPQGEAPQLQRALAQSVPRLGGRLRGLIHTRFEL